MPYYSMSKTSSQPKTQVPEIPKTITEPNAIEPQPDKPRSRPRVGNPALKAMNRVGKLGAEAKAEAAVSKAQRETSRQEAITEWKKMT
jgi:hypothetical protein